MAKLDVVVLEHNIAYQGYMRLDQYQLKHTVFDGTWSIDLSREVLERGHAVAVLPYDPVADKVVLIEQFRIGGYTSPKSSPWQIECVAGMIEPQQLPEDAAYRETQEETGLRIHDLTPVHTYLTSPGCTSETVQLYCGLVDSRDAGGLFGLAEEGEYIRVFTSPVDEAFSWLSAGRIQNGMTIIAIQWLQLHHVEIRTKWHSTG